MNLKSLGNCPGCGCPPERHAGGFCYGLPDLVGVRVGGVLRAAESVIDGHWCRWRWLGEGNVWGVPPGWWNDDDLPEGKSFSVAPTADQLREMESL